MLRSAWLVIVVAAGLGAACDPEVVEVVDSGTNVGVHDTGTSATDAGSDATTTDVVRAEVGSDTSDTTGADGAADVAAADGDVPSDDGEALDAAPDVEQPDAGPGPVVVFTLVDLSETSDTTGLEVSPADYTGTVTGWYFTHAS